MRDEANTVDLTAASLRALGCIFAPIGKGPRTLFGRDDQGVIRHISQVARGAKGLTCPDCQHPLIPKKGQELRHHFAHASAEECRTAGETMLHLLAKSVIADAKRLDVPEVKVVDPRSGRAERLRMPETQHFDTVELEVWESGIRPDVVGIRHTSEGGPDERLLIEVRVTHAVDDRKLDRLRQRREAAVEIDLSGIRTDLDSDGFARAILKAAPRIWLSHPQIERLREEEARRRAARAELDRVAMAQRDEAHRRARLRPARPADKAERAVAELEVGRWQSIGAPSPLEVPGDDSIFSAEPILWRTQVLAGIAPWHRPPSMGPISSLPKPQLFGPSQPALYRKPLSAMVKQEFFMPGVHHGGSQVPIDSRLPEQAISTFCQAFLAALAPRMSGEKPSRQLDGIGEAINLAWQTRQSIREGLLRLVGELALRSMELSLHGIHLVSEADVERALSSGRVISGKELRLLIWNLANDAIGGRSHIYRPRSVEDLRAYGLMIVVRGDEALGREERALQALRLPRN